MQSSEILFAVNTESDPGKFRSGKFTPLSMVGGALIERYERWIRKNAVV